MLTETTCTDIRMRMSKCMQMRMQTASREDRSLCKGMRGCAAGMGYVFTSSGHKFKILSIVLGYHLPVVCICYGDKMRMNGIFWSEFKPTCNGEKTA